MQPPIDYLSKEGPLSPSDAAVAILVLDDGRYLLQLRDQKPGIFFPGYWGLFGGAIDPGETPENGLRRELHEELGVAFGTLTYFTMLTMDFAPHGFGTVSRHYYEASISQVQMRSLALGEGTAMRPFDGLDLVTTQRVTPYDAFAIWLHLTRSKT